MSIFSKQIQNFLDQLHKVTKEESDYILEIINWPEEKRTAFRLAKKIFEEEMKENDQHNNTNENNF